MSQLQFPEVAPAVRPNGDSVVEMRMDGELVAELNMTTIMRMVFIRLGILKEPSRHLTVIK